MVKKEATNMCYKSHAVHLCAVLGIALGLLAHTADAATVLIDGTSPDYTLNGSFESGSDGVVDDWEGNENNTALAADLSIENDSNIGTSPATPSDGSQYIIVGRQGSGGGGNDFGVYVNTGHTLQVGEIFDLSFFYGEHANLATTDSSELAWQLFTTTTDDDTGTVDDVIASGTVTVPNSMTLIQESLSGIGNVTSASAGETLFLAFTPGSVTDTGDDGDFFAVDQVNLAVVPAPAALPAGLAMMGLLIIKRRRG